MSSYSIVSFADNLSSERVFFSPILTFSVPTIKTLMAVFVYRLMSSLDFPSSNALTKFHGSHENWFFSWTNQKKWNNVFAFPTQILFHNSYVLTHRRQSYKLLLSIVKISIRRGQSYKIVISHWVPRWLICKSNKIKHHLNVYISFVIMLH